MRTNKKVPRDSLLFQINLNIRIEYFNRQYYNLNSECVTVN